MFNRKDFKDSDLVDDDLSWTVIDHVYRRGLQAKVKVRCVARSVVIAFGSAPDRRGGAAMARETAEASLTVDCLDGDRFLLSLSVKKPKRMPAMRPRCDRQQMLEAVAAFVEAL